MKTYSIGSMFVVATVLVCSQTTVGSETIGERRLRVEEYRDKMAGGWIGQMIGVGWAGPTEFKYKGQIIPEENVPVWEPTRVNQFRRDDIYVEMTFLRSMELYGLDVSPAPPQVPSLPKWRQTSLSLSAAISWRSRSPNWIGWKLCNQGCCGTRHRSPDHAKRRAKRRSDGCIPCAATNFSQPIRHYLDL